MFFWNGFLKRDICLLKNTLVNKLNKSNSLSHLFYGHQWSWTSHCIQEWMSKSKTILCWTSYLSFKTTQNRSTKLFRFLISATFWTQYPRRFELISFKWLSLLVLYQATTERSQTQLLYWLIKNRTTIKKWVSLKKGRRLGNCFCLLNCPID